MVGRSATAIDGRVLVDAPLSWAGELNRMAMRNGITLCTLGVVPTRLEDAFFHLTDSTLGSVGAMACRRTHGATISWVTNTRVTTWSRWSRPF